MPQDEKQESNINEKIQNAFTTLLYPIIRARSAFHRNPAGATAIDNVILFDSGVDVISYLPRASQIAFFSPFPNLWFTRGDSSLSFIMRSVTGVEMIIAYASLPFFAMAAYANRKNVKFQFIIPTIILIQIILASIFINIGALYRFRYPFFILIITIGISFYFSDVRGKRKI